MTTLIQIGFEDFNFFKSNNHYSFELETDKGIVEADIIISRGVNFDKEQLAYIDIKSDHNLEKYELEFIEEIIEANLYLIQLRALEI